MSFTISDGIEEKRSPFNAAWASSVGEGDSQLHLFEQHRDEGIRLSAVRDFDVMDGGNPELPQQVACEVQVVPK